LIFLLKIIKFDNNPILRGSHLGGSILSTTLVSIFLAGAIDIFSTWYLNFLKKRKIRPDLICFIIRSMFVLLAYLFWRAFIHDIETHSLSSTHFFFALFVYCMYRLIASFYKNNKFD